MDERLRFIARLLEGEKMAPLCREFGISRVTGYKIYERYKTCGLDGLNDRSRRCPFSIFVRVDIAQVFRLALPVPPPVIHSINS